MIRINIGKKINNSIGMKIKITNEVKIKNKIIMEIKIKIGIRIEIKIEIKTGMIWLVNRMTIKTNDKKFSDIKEDI